MFQYFDDRVSGSADRSFLCRTGRGNDISLISNYGITSDMESKKAWPDGYIVKELSRIPSNFRSEGTIQDFLKEQDIPGIAGIDTRALTKMLREKGTMNWYDHYEWEL